MLEIITQSPITLAELITLLGEPQDRIMAELDRYIDAGIVKVAAQLKNNSPLYYFNGK